MFNCSSCNSQYTEGTVCSVCKRNYDFACSGVTEAGYRKLGDRKNAWRCPKCKASAVPSPAATSPQPYQMDKLQDQLNKILFQLTPLASLVEDVKYIKIELSSLKDSVEMAHEVIVKFTDKVNALETRVVEAEQVAKEIPALKSEITRLNQELQDRDQWARANNIEIRGIPLKNNENLYE